MVEKLPHTERRNPASQSLDELPTLSVLRLINDEDGKVAEAVAKTLPDIAKAVEALAASWRRGGRWLYVGAGTSGRIAAMDAAECPPTFGVPQDRVRAVVAGDTIAEGLALEGAEDDTAAAIRDLQTLNLAPRDAVVGLAASGRTPYTVTAVRYATQLGCATVGISNNPGTELSYAARIGIEVLTGPEVLTGSTRLKAGTAQKLVLNMLSTAAFTRLNKVYENWMVDVQATNQKLKSRACRIVHDAAEVSEPEAEELLRSVDGWVKAAILMGRGGVSADAARDLLNATDGNVREALRLANKDRG